MKYCSNCGARLDDNANFCENCGMPVDHRATRYGEDPSETYGDNISSTDDKALGIICYLTFIGWLVILIISAKDDRSRFLKFHLNQALILILFNFIDIVPVLGWIWGIFMIVCWFICFIGACTGKMNEAPLIGRIHILD